MALDFKKETELNALRIEKPLAFNDHIKINNVSYNYKDSKNQTLKRVILDIHKEIKLASGNFWGRQKHINRYHYGFAKATNGELELDGLLY